VSGCRVGEVARAVVESHCVGCLGSTSKKKVLGVSMGYNEAFLRDKYSIFRVECAYRGVEELGSELRNLASKQWLIRRSR
jgi:hypothetical protein